MKLLELYLNQNGNHKFVAAEGLRRTEIAPAQGNNHALQAQALALIEADDDFERRVRIFDEHGIMLRGKTTMNLSVEQLRS